MYAIEMTRIFIEFGVDFNVRGLSWTNSRGNIMSSAKTCFLYTILVSHWDKCVWTSEDKTQIFGMILDSGRADPHLKDSNGNDALKLAVLHKIPLNALKVIAKKAVETDPGDLFTSRSRHGKTVFDDAVEATLEVKKYLEELKQNSNSNQEHPSPSQSSHSHPLVIQFQEFVKRFPVEFGLIELIMVNRPSGKINQNYLKAPLYTKIMERLVSASSSSNIKWVEPLLESQLVLTKRFIELGVDFNRIDHLGRTCLVFVMSHADYYHKPRRVLYQIIKLMLENGANPSIKDEQDNDALKHAILKSFPLKGIQEILESARHDQLKMLTSVNKKGLTAIDMTSDNDVKKFLSDKLSVLRSSHDNTKSLNTNEFQQKYSCPDFEDD